MSDEFKVFVDDNYHYMDEGERYAVGSFSSLDEAIDKCKEVCIKSVRDLYEEGTTPEELKAQWSRFGEDPYVFGGVGAVPFSAREFISFALCKEIIESIENETAET